MSHNRVLFPVLCFIFAVVVVLLALLLCLPCGCVFSWQIPVVLELYKQAGIALKPLVWALAMGSCLGG